MRYRILLAGGLLAIAASCANRADVTVREPIQHPEYGLISAQPVEGWQVFGADVPDETPMTLAALLADANRHKNTHVVVEGVVHEVCVKKGCWMTLENDGRTVRVRFKDYKFFVPKDCTGKTVRMHAWFETKELSVAEVQHYLEDAGRHEEAAQVTEPQVEYSLYASGVRLRD